MSRQRKEAREQSHPFVSGSELDSGQQPEEGPSQVGHFVPVQGGGQTSQYWMDHHP